MKLARHRQSAERAVRERGSNQQNVRAHFGNLLQDPRSRQVTLQDAQLAIASQAAREQTAGHDVRIGNHYRDSRQVQFKG